MLKIERVVEPHGSIVEIAVRGMRNPMNSWLQSDSDIIGKYEKDDEPSRVFYVDEYVSYYCGPKDTSLMQSLAHAGSSHRKFMRMIPVSVSYTHLKPFHHGNIPLSSVWVSPHRILSGIATLGLLCWLRHFHYIITAASKQGGIRKRHALSFP